MIRRHPESPDELIATARIQFDALAAIGVLTQGQAGSILRLLQGDGRTLSPHDRAFRDNILRYLKKEADFVTVSRRCSISINIPRLAAKSLIGTLCSEGSREKGCASYLCP